MIYNEKGALGSIQVLFQRIIKVSSVCILDEKTCETIVVQKLLILGIFLVILGFTKSKISQNPHNSALFDLFFQKLGIIWDNFHKIAFSGQSGRHIVNSGHSRQLLDVSMALQNYKTLFLFF